MHDVNGPIDSDEEADFYVDAGGLYVFTSTYLRRRGTCCGNKCRHCPFDWRNVRPSQIERGERPTVTSSSITAPTEITAPTDRS